jgi:hypothetical protein
MHSALNFAIFILLQAVSYPVEYSNVKELHDLKGSLVKYSGFSPKSPPRQNT